MPRKKKQTVLVVDDDASVLRAMERLLRSFDYEVLVFRSAEEFLARDIPSSGACLLLDIFLPGKNGVELCEVLKTAGRRVPTVLMTARDDETTRKLADEIDVIAFLSKPFDENVLLEAIARALAKA